MLNIFKNYGQLGAGEMAQQLRALAALAEHLGFSSPPAW